MLKKRIHLQNMKQLPQKFHLKLKDIEKGEWPLQEYYDSLSTSEKIN